jgi:hypothetical protein
MLKQKSRYIPAIALVAVMMLIAGGAAIASNTGFKANIALAPTIAGATNPEIGNNYLSLPYFNPYPFAAQLCAQLGLDSAGLDANLIRRIDDTGSVNNAICGSGAANTLAIVPGNGIIIRRVAGSTTPASVIIVGSHNPTLSITVPASSVAVVGKWFAVPYHTTAVTANDICLQAGMTTTPALQSGQAQVFNPVSGTPTTVQCGSASAIALNLTLGQAVRLRQTPTSGPRTFVPAHF